MTEPSKDEKPDGSAIARRREAARGFNRPGYADRREEIIAAAAAVFKQRGYRGTTLSHIAEALATDRASLYYYFASKEELFREIVGRAVTVNLQTATEIRDELAPAPEKLRRLIVAIMQSYADYWPVLYLVIQENLSHAAPERADWANEVRSVNNNFMDVMIAIVEEGQSEGTLRNSAPAWLEAYGIMGMVGWTSRWFNPIESDISARDIGETFADMLLLGLTGTDDASMSRLPSDARAPRPPSDLAPAKASKPQRRAR